MFYLANIIIAYIVCYSFKLLIIIKYINTHLLSAYIFCMFDEIIYIRFLMSLF